jgi:hypothetical protein
VDNNRDRLQREPEHKIGDKNECIAGEEADERETAIDKR